MDNSHVQTENLQLICRCVKSANFNISVVSEDFKLASDLSAVSAELSVCTSLSLITKSIQH